MYAATATLPLYPFDIFCSSTFCSIKQLIHLLCFNVKLGHNLQFFARMLQNFVFAEWTDNFIHLLRIITIKLLHLYLRVVQMKQIMLRPYFVHSPPPTAHWRNEIMIRNSSVHTSPLPTGWIEYGRRVDFHCPLPSEWAMGSGWVWTQQMESSPRWADSTHRPNETRFIPKKSTETLSSYISILAKPIPKIQKASESSIFSLSNVIKFIFLR